VANFWIWPLVLAAMSASGLTWALFVDGPMDIAAAGLTGAGAFVVAYRLWQSRRGPKP
jgi:hypothetical protein